MEYGECKKYFSNIFDWLNMQDMTRNVLIGFMVIVAVINLITCLIILVLVKNKDGRRIKITRRYRLDSTKIFLRHSALITITGIITGTALALGLLWLQQATGFIKLKEEAYYLSTVDINCQAGGPGPCWNIDRLFFSNDDTISAGKKVQPVSYTVQVIICERIFCCHCSIQWFGPAFPGYGDLYIWEVHYFFTNSFRLVTNYYNPFFIFFYRCYIYL